MQATPVLKHIYGQLPPWLDRHVAAQSSGVIFLFRKNLKLAALSSAIARRSNTWQARPEQPLGRIEPDDIRDIARSMKAKRNRGLQECRASKTPLLILPYEDLFPSGENAATLRQQTLKAVLDFLGQHTSLTVPCQEQMQAAFDRHIAPDRKLNTASTYRLVDNIDEIQASLSLTGQLGF